MVQGPWWLFNAFRRRSELGESVLDVKGAGKWIAVAGFVERTGRGMLLVEFV